jgi:hypothetical protein
MGLGGLRPEKKAQGVQTSAQYLLEDGTGEVAKPTFMKTSIGAIAFVAGRLL